MEAGMTTKEKIVYESLKLFSQKGYTGVSMREIASAVGIKGASIYNHFKGKQDIFQAIFSEMTKLYEQASTAMNVPADDGAQTAQMYVDMNIEQLTAMAEGLFSFFTQNEFAVLFRRLLVSEQGKSMYALKCLKDYYIEAPVTFQSNIFRGMQQNGCFTGFDSQIMALHFYSPIYFILNKFDLGYPYAECLEQVKQHVQYFCQLYKKS